MISFSKPHIHPVEVMPVLPDSNMWKYPCAQVKIQISWETIKFRKSLLWWKLGVEVCDCLTTIVSGYL